MVSIESTAAQALSFTHAPITSASPALLNLTAFRSAAANVTSSLTALSTDQIFRLPLRITSQIDRALLFIWNQVILGGLRNNIFARGGLAAADGGAGAQAMADAVAQPGLAQAIGDTGPESWATFFAEAFQASTFKSYWGMLHYLTSRWSFTCFAMVRKNYKCNGGDADHL